MLFTLIVLIEPTNKVEASTTGSSGLSNKLNSDGKSYSVAKGTCTDSNIVIPSFYNGLPVVKIYELAFVNLYTLESITISSSVTNIGALAFYRCEKLTINCKFTSQPSSWDVDWNIANCPVVWLAKEGIAGDLDGNELVNTSDVIYLLMHTYFPDAYPIEFNVKRKEEE